MSYGLKGNVKNMVAGLNKHRETKGDINLATYLAKNYKDASGNGLEVNHLYADLNIDNDTTVAKLYSDTDTAPLMSEIIRDAVRRGIGLAARERAQASMAGTYDAGTQRFMSREVFLDPVYRGLVQSTFYPDLVIREEKVAQPTVTIPKIELSDAELKDSAEAATAEEGTVTYGSKDVKLRKKMRGFKVTYESIKYNSLSLAQIFFEDAGRILGHTLNSMAVDAILNGDQADASESAAVIGVDNTSNGITYKDLARVAIRFAMIGRTGLQAIGNEDSLNNYVNLEEMKKKFTDNAMLNTMVKSPLMFPTEIFASAKVTGSGINAKLVIQDPSASLVQLTAAPLLVETDKIIAKQLEQAVASITTGFAKIQRNASVVINPAVLYSGNPFPTWMQNLT